jgi:hypothetical protein
VHLDLACVPVGVQKRTRHDLHEILDGVRPEQIHLRPRDQGAVHREERIFGRGTDEDHPTTLDGRQERILLRLVEAVNLVDEEKSALTKR